MLNSYLLPAFGQQKSKNIMSDFIERQCRYLLTAGGKSGVSLSSKTVADTLSLIRNILKFAIKKGNWVPCDGMDIHVK